MLSNFVVWIASNSSSKCERVSMGPIYLSRSWAANYPAWATKSHKSYLTFTVKITNNPINKLLDIRTKSFSIDLSKFNGAYFVNMDHYSSFDRSRKIHPSHV
jgi:hypothetical protein